MAKINDLGAPIVLDGVVFNDLSLLMMEPAVDESGQPLSIKLNTDDSNLFIEFCKASRIKFLIENDLQSLFCRDGVNYLTAHLPLITFRQEFQPNIQNAIIGEEHIVEITNMLRHQNKYKNKFNELLADISQKISKWKDLGVDMVAISGVDIQVKHQSDFI